MRKAIRTQTRRRLRLGLPAVAAAAAFALTGCGSEEGEAPFGADVSMPGAGEDAGGGGEEPNPDDMPTDIEVPGPDMPDDPGGDDGGGGGDTGGSGGDTGGATGGGGGGTVPTVADLEGYWLTGSAATDSSLSISSGTVSFIENTEAEGDVCSGTASDDGTIALDYCTQFGSVAWTSMNATTEMSGSILIVTWDDGTVQEYQPL
jgi:hypothetical protein